MVPASRRRTARRCSRRGYSSGGSGFGLAIVERIVDTHGWAIDVTDSDAGGTRFVVTGVETLPAE